MSDEITSSVLSTSSKAIEAALEIVRMFAPFAEQILSTVFHKSVDGINFVGRKIADAKATGTVSNNGLIMEAQKAGSPVCTTNNFLARDAEQVAAKAKEYKIPVAIIGNGEKQTLEFLERDKGIVEQITQEIMQERLKEAPETVKCFKLSENNVSAMKAAFDENGIECQFLQDKDGKISCIYPAENKEQVELIKDDYKRTFKEINDDFSVQRDENGISVTDERLGKTIPLTPLNKSQVSEALRNNFGYSASKADLAANKMCYELDLNKDKFMAKSNQIDNLNSLKTNIRYESDDITIRDVRFDEVNFKDGNATHIVLRNGDKVVGLTPSEMTESEMKNICVKQLGLTENQAELSVAKAMKIDNQVRSQMEERAVGKNGLSEGIQIERTADNAFLVKRGDKKRSYNLSTVNLDKKISKDFGIPSENAMSIIEKAKKQSVLQNKINAAAKKKPSIKADAPKINIGKGLGRK